MSKKIIFDLNNFFSQAQLPITHLPSLFHNKYLGFNNISQNYYRNIFY